MSISFCLRVFEQKYVEKLMYTISKKYLEMIVCNGLSKEGCLYVSEKFIKVTLSPP